MNVLMNGEIYLKRGPEIIKFDKEQHEKNKMRTEKLKQEMLKDNDSSNPFLSIMFQLQEVEKKFDDAYGKLSYAGCDSFWIFNKMEKGIKMMEKEASLEIPSPETTTIRNIDSLEELDEKFIPLREFLNEAEYVGKYFKDNAKQRYEVYNKCMLLYKTPDIWLTYERNRYLGTEGFFIRSRVPGKENLNYKTYGLTHKEFKDKNELYSAIFKQLTSSKQNIL